MFHLRGLRCGVRPGGSDTGAAPYFTFVEFANYLDAASILINMLSKEEAQELAKRAEAGAFGPSRRAPAAPPPLDPQWRPVWPEGRLAPEPRRAEL